jgi:cytochrome c-type biogenesis protein CcmH/NrfF
MDIMDLLRNPVFAKIIIWGAFLILGVIYILIRIIASVRRPQDSTSTATEVDKSSKQPMSGSESIGSIGMRLGADVRDVWEMGYSDDQINDVLTGAYSLGEMYTMEPNGNTISSKGKEILAKKSQMK